MLCASKFSFHNPIFSPAVTNKLYIPKEFDEKFAEQAPTTDTREQVIDLKLVPDHEAPQLNESEEKRCDLYLTVSIVRDC